MLDGEGELSAAVADMAAFDLLTPQAVVGGVLPLLEKLRQSPSPPFFVADGNVPVDTLALLARTAAAGGHAEFAAALVGEDGAVLTTAHAAPSPGGVEDTLDMQGNVVRGGQASPAGAAHAHAHAHAHGADSCCGDFTSGPEAQPDDADIDLTDVVPLPFLFEPTSVAKCVRIVEAGVLHLTTIVKPNRLELGVMATAVRAAMALPSVGLEGDAPGGGTASPVAALEEEEAEEEAMMGEGDEGEVESGEEEEAADLDYATLTAAQTVLAAMVRPSGVSSPVTQTGLHLAHRTLKEYADAADRSLKAAARAGAGGDASEEARRAAAVAQSASFRAEMAGLNARAVAAPVADGDDDTSDPLFPGGLIEGRKHVLVSLGSAGVLWLSAPPAVDDTHADLLATLPFFSAAQHAALGLDFKLCPAPPAQLVKCTGAGDTMVGAVVAGLCGGGTMAGSITRGLAASSVAVQASGGRSTIADGLGEEAVEKAMTGVVPVDEVYG